MNALSVLSFGLLITVSVCVIGVWYRGVGYIEYCDDDLMGLLLPVMVTCDLFFALYCVLLLLIGCIYSYNTLCI